MSGIIGTIFRVLKLFFYWGMSLLGIAILLVQSPIPGTDQNTTNAIGVILFVLGVVFERMFTEDNRTRRQARIWKKEMNR